MNLCGSCRFWGNAGDAGTVRQCTRIIHDPENYFDRESPPEWIAKYPRDVEHWNAVRASKAVSVDGSGYFAAVRCRDDFGCVMHEPKEQDGDTGPTS